MDLSASSLLKASKQGSARVNLVRKLLGAVLASSTIVLSSADNRTTAEDLAKPVVVAPAMKQEREIFDDFRRLELVLERGFKSGVIPRDLEEELLQSQDQLMNFKADRHYVTFTACLIEQLAKSKPSDEMLRALLTTNNPNLSSDLLRLLEFGDLSYDQVLKLAASARLKCRKTNDDLQNCFVHLDKEYKFQLEEILPTVITNRIESGRLSEQFAKSLTDDIAVVQNLKAPKLGSAVAELYTVLELYSKHEIKDKELATILNKLRDATKGKGSVPDDVCLILSFMKEDLQRQRHNEQSEFKETTLLANFNNLYEVFLSSNEERLALMQDFRFLKDNIEKFYPLTEEKIKHILLVQKEIERAIVDGLLPRRCNFSGGFYMSYDALTFFTELREANQQAGFEPIPDSLMLALAKINSPNVISSLISLLQQGKVSAKELTVIAHNANSHLVYINSIYLNGGKFSSAELSFLGEVLAELALKMDKPLPEEKRERDSDGDLKAFTREQLLRRVEVFCELLELPSFMKELEGGQQIASINVATLAVANAAEMEKTGTVNPEMDK